MKALPLFFCATAITATSALATPVQLQLTYDNLQFRFTPDDNFSDSDVSGFLYPGDDFKYDAATADAELRETFENDLPFGGAEFQSQETGGSNDWVLPQELNPFSSVTFTLTLDTDDFLKSNITGRSDLESDTEYRTYDGNITVTVFDAGGNVVETSTVFNGFVTGASDGLSIGDGATTDVLAFGASDEVADEFKEEASIGFYFADLDGGLNGGNWFDLLAEDENALTLALAADASLTRFFEYEELMLGQGTDGFGSPTTEQLGIYRIQGQFAGAVGSTGTEDAPLFPSDVIVDEDGVPTYSFSIDVPVDSAEPIWIDPDIAVGYVYNILDEFGAKQEIAGIAAPDFTKVADPDGYIIEVVFDDGTSIENIALVSGEQLLFADVPELDGKTVLEIILTGIDEELMLDPTNPVLFQTGLFAAGSGLLNFTQTPIVEFYEPQDGDGSPPAVPLPMPALMLLSGLAGLGLMRRKRKCA